MLASIDPPVYVGHGYFDVDRHGLRCYGFRRTPYDGHPMAWTVLFPAGSRVLTAKAVVDDFGDLVVVS